MAKSGAKIVRTGDFAPQEAVAGSPTYDARIDPTITAGEVVGSERLQQQRNLHLFGGKAAPAAAYSHAYDATPNPLAVQIMGLAAQRDAIDRLVSRKDLAPFPGVELGHVPAVAPAPSTNPVLQPFAHYTHHAHQVESKKATRRRFGHAGGL